MSINFYELDKTKGLKALKFWNIFGQLGLLHACAKPRILEEKGEKVLLLDDG